MTTDSGKLWVTARRFRWLGSRSPCRFTLTVVECHAKAPGRVRLEVIRFLPTMEYGTSVTLEFRAPSNVPRFGQGQPFTPGTRELHATATGVGSDKANVAIDVVK